MAIPWKRKMIFLLTIEQVHEEPPRKHKGTQNKYTICSYRSDLPSMANLIKSPGNSVESLWNNHLINKQKIQVPHRI